MQPVPVEIHQIEALVIGLWILSIPSTIIIAELKHRSGLIWGGLALPFGPMMLLAVGFSPSTGEFSELDFMCENCGRNDKAMHSALLVVRGNAPDPLRRTKWREC